MSKRNSNNLNYTERRAKSREEIRLAWESGHAPLDPGLREKFHELPRVPMRIICCPLGKDVNQGGILRVAEAFRLEHAYFELPTVGDPYDFTGSTGVKAWQPHEWCRAEDAIASARSSGYRIYGLTLTANTIPLREVAWEFPSALVVGEEKDGLSPEIEAMIDVSIAIPLYGLITSLNVTTATAIAVHSAIETYSKQNPDFLPARNISRAILGHETVDYESE